MQMEIITLVVIRLALNVYHYRSGRPKEISLGCDSYDDNTNIYIDV